MKQQITDFIIETEKDKLKKIKKKKNEKLTKQFINRLIKEKDLKETNSFDSNKASS